MVATNTDVFCIKLEVTNVIAAAIKKVNTQIKNIHILLVDVLFSALNASLAILDFAIQFSLGKILVAIHKVNFTA